MCLRFDLLRNIHECSQITNDKVYGMYIVFHIVPYGEKLHTMCVKNLDISLVVFLYSAEGLFHL